VDDARAAVAAAHCREWGRIVAGLVRQTGDWDLAEECAQDAFERAMQRWPVDGVPDRPGAWLTVVARNRALDRIRRSSTEQRKHEEVAAAMTTSAPDDLPPSSADEQLSLVFACCHPALAPDARVALTLRAVGGLNTAEIARAFIVPERTMTQRLFRAKRKIRAAAIPVRIPPLDQFPGRLDAVLSVVYLVFNEGYRATGGPVADRPDLAAEAIRLARLVTELLPDEPEPAGLLALMELHDARRGGRVDDAGDLIALDEQDRSRWDRARIDRAAALLDAAVARGRPGPYQLQAAIAACHATAPSAAATDWIEIAALYARLAEVIPSPVVELNRAVAVGMADGPDAGLRIVDALERRGELSRYHLLPATRADLLRRAGRMAESASAYRAAIELAGSDADRRFLLARLRGVEAASRFPT
jgi:RNA polymerase sigma-70 factor (ECF subfamily)